MPVKEEEEEYTPSGMIQKLANGFYCCTLCLVFSS